MLNNTLKWQSGCHDPRLPFAHRLRIESRVSLSLEQQPLFRAEGARELCVEVANCGPVECRIKAPSEGRSWRLRQPAGAENEETLFLT
jgi:hypothetical protein